MIYLDDSATTQLHLEVLEAMLPYLKDLFGNPSSTYKLGQISRFAIDEARRIIATYINSSQQEIIFTAGGTESTNLAIKGVAEALAMGNSNAFNPGNVHIVTSKIEHSATLGATKHLGLMGYKIHLLNVDEYGYINLDELESLLDSIKGSPIIASFNHANSEIGTIQDVATFVTILKKYKAYIHLDAMQSAKFYKLDCQMLNIDLMTFAPHKFEGPKGIGALYIKKGTPIIRQSDGGQQEYYLRSGTENVAGIVGFGKAVEILQANRELNYQKVQMLQKYFEEKLVENFNSSICFNTKALTRMPSITSVVFKNIQADQMLIRLDMKDICVSAGSACNSGSIQISPVLREIINEEDAKNTVRFSFGKNNTIQEIDLTIEALKEILSHI